VCLFGAALAPGGRMHEIHAAFMARVAEYDTADAWMHSRARHLVILSEAKDLPDSPVGLGDVSRSSP
jgi:hypothetical protein